MVRNVSSSDGLSIINPKLSEFRVNLTHGVEIELVKATEVAAQTPLPYHILLSRASLLKD